MIASLSFRLLIVVIAFILGIYFSIKPPTEDIEDIEGFHNDKSDDKSGNEDDDKIVTLSTDEKCPNLLIQEDGGISLINTEEKRVPGVNPMRFNNLEEYVQFVDWQHSQGVRCPVLFLQKTEDAQGSVSYRARPDIVNPQGGLPATSLEQIKTRCETMPVKPDLDNLNIEINDIPYFTSGCGNITGEVALNTGPQETLFVDSQRNDMPYNNNSMPSFDPTSFYQGMITPLDQMTQLEKQQKISPNTMDTNWGGKEYTRSLINQGDYDGDMRKLEDQTDPSTIITN